MKYLILCSILLPAITQAADMVRVNCQVLGKDAWFEVMRDGGSGDVGSVAMYKKTGSSLDAYMELARISGKGDIFELSQNGYRLNVEAMHHNTVIRISSDVSIFGGSVSNPEEAAWYGKAYVSANLAQDLGGSDAMTVDVSCSNEI